MKALLKGLGLAIAALALVMGGWAACAWGLPKLVGERTRTPPADGVEIWVRSNGVHTDFVLPVRTEWMAWDTMFPASDFRRVDPSSAFIAFGWGDKGFYLHTPTWDDLTFGTAFRAAFWLSDSAMHVTYDASRPVEGARCRRVVLSREGYRALVAFIRESFEWSETQTPLRIAHPGYTERDAFYEAQGTYSLFQTCNEWTRRGLQTAGVPMGPWAPLASGVMDSLAAPQ